MKIDWSRVAEPQEDGYDTDVALHLVSTIIAPGGSKPYQRRPTANFRTIFDGEIAVRHITREPAGAPRIVNAHFDYPTIDIGCEYVRRWPVAFRQFQRLMDSFHPTHDSQIPPGQKILGSSSHSYERFFGTLYATVDDAHGLAQAFVHEMAHNKLRGMGLFVESTQRLIANPPDQRFDSPIRKDILRPMTAVFHAQYSFIYVTALDVKLIESETDEKELRSWMMLLSRNVPRMEEGDQVLREQLRTDKDGDAFFEGFFRWSERVLQRGNELLHEHRTLLSAA